MADGSTKYYLEDFTLDSYRDILTTAVRSGYRFSSFTNHNLAEKEILLRHDVDFSLKYGVELAKIEKDMGIKSTYFLLLHSDFYNLFDRKNSGYVRQIIQMGHDIGIHFDTHYYRITHESEIEIPLEFESNIIQSLFRTSPVAVSFHVTTDFTMSCTKPSYCGLVNTYSSQFQKDWKYCSDSNGYWRFDRLSDLLTSAEYSRMQILLHPVWWQDEVRTPQQRVWHVIDENAQTVKRNYLALLKRFGRKNVT